MVKCELDYLLEELKNVLAFIESLYEWFYLWSFVPGICLSMIHNNVVLNLTSIIFSPCSSNVPTCIWYLLHTSLMIPLPFEEKEKNVKGFSAKLFKGFFNALDQIINCPHWILMLNSLNPLEISWVPKHYWQADLLLYSTLLALR